jgi:hypothetical protein
LVFFDIEMVGGLVQEQGIGTADQTRVNDASRCQLPLRAARGVRAAHRVRRTRLQDGTHASRLMRAVSADGKARRGASARVKRTISSPQGKCYGYRRVGAALRQPGVTVNGKKLRRLMRENGPQPKQRRRHVVTTDSDHTGRSILTYRRASFTIARTNFGSLT